MTVEAVEEEGEDAEEEGEAAEEEGEDAEDEEEMIRRLAWIKYYVKEGQPDKALELGWDGDTAFIAADGDATASATDPSAGGSGLGVDPQKTMCRI